jgi:hypothetical protein
MNGKQLEVLFYELDQEASRLRRWADNVEMVMGMDYGITPDHKHRADFLEATAAISRAGQCLEEAADIVRKLTP